MSQEKKERKPWDRDLEAEAAFLEQHALEHTEDMPEPDAKEGLARLMQRIDKMEREKTEGGMSGLHERELFKEELSDLEEADMGEDVSAAEEMPVLETETGEKDPVSDKKKRRGRVRWKVLAVLAAVLVLLFAVEFGTVGKRVYTPEAVTEPRDGEVVIKVNNDERIESEVEEEEIYQEIENRLGIRALRLGYKPQGMDLYKVVISETYGEAKLFFSYNEQMLYIYISRDFSRAGSYVKTDGDGKIIETVENFILDKEIEVVEGKNEGEGHLFLSEISHDNVFYAIYGDIELEEFLKIIQEIYKKNT